jgi:hypothetical protein
MKLPYKVVLINITLAVVLTIIAVLVSGGNFVGGADTAFAFGLVCLLLGLLDLLFGFVALIAGSKEWRNGFLLSGAALLLLSGISCGGGAAFV